MPRNEAETKFGFRLYQGGAVPGKELRVVEVERWDVEACGGTHVNNTSEVGLIKILKSERVQDGVERIEFTAGPNALKMVQKIERTLLEVADILDAPLGKLKEAASNTIYSMKGMRHKLDRFMQTASKQTARDLLNNAEKIEDVKIIIDTVEAEADFIIEVGNVLSYQDDPIVAVVHSEVEPRIVVTASEAAIALGIHSGKLVSEVADIIGGGGGGEQHFGQGGGGNIDRFKADKKLILKVVKDQLKNHP
jgi:alanyl-tRNA synthetase